MRKGTPLPSGWAERLLDDVAERGSGHTPDKSHPEYWNGGINWVSLADGPRLDRGYIAETDKQISELGLRHSSAVIHPRGSVILLRDADIGRCGILGSDMAVSQHFIAWRCPDDGPLDSEFLYYQLQNRKHEFERVANGSTIPTIGLQFFKNFKVRYPERAEQSRIAEVLRAWDQAIALNERRLTLVQRRYRAVRQRLFSSRAIEASGWSLSSLGKIAERVRRKNDGEQHPVMTISGKYGFLRQDEKFSRFMAGESLENYTLLKEGEFSYNKGNSYTYPQGCIYRLEQAFALVPNVYISFRLHDGLDGNFFAALFQAGYLNRQLARLINSGVRNNGLLNLNPDDFFSCDVPVPPENEQARIANIVQVAVQEIAAIERKIDLLDKQKHGLMRKLVTGEWRVPNTEKGTVRIPEEAAQ